MDKMKKNKCFIAYHSGGLKECIETEKQIPYKTFIKLIGCGLYTFYAYDERIGAYRYLIEDLQNNYNLPSWLHYYGKRKPI